MAFLGEPDRGSARGGARLRAVRASDRARYTLLGGALFLFVAPPLFDGDAGHLEPVGGV